MSGRVSGRINHGPENHQVNTCVRGPSVDDSPGSSTVARRATAAVAHRVLASLTDADCQLIDVLATVRIATGGQLQRLFWDDNPSGQRTGRRRLQRLTGLRVLARLERQVGGVRGGSRGHTYALDAIGQRIADADNQRPRRPTTPGTPFVDHLLAVTEAYVQLRERQAAGVIEIDGFVGEPDAWRTYPGHEGRPVWLKPDAYGEWHDEDWDHRVFFEIDMATENPKRIARKGRTYLDYLRSGSEPTSQDEPFPLVIWVAPTNKRAATLERALTIDGAPDLFRIVTLDMFGDFITNH